ncbi:MAG: transcription antitermination factor NusB [Methylococcales bacterium]|jgi:transcription antitermination protein NusB|nr:transcription antitermination factor NusB [Methylococcales bacterium]MBT7444628.1 transcription antitermination factor NusB [Methylococcales bacterium]
MSHARSKARQCLVQALYEWQMSGSALSQIEADFLANPHNKNMEAGFFKKLLHAIPKGTNELDDHLSKVLDRKVDELDLVEKAILRLGVYELLHKPEVPYRVVINEGVELAKVFGADKSHRYINGVLDKMASALRATEIKMKKKKPK